VVLKILDVPNAEHAPKINNNYLLQFAICNICQEIVTSEKYAAFKTLCFCDSSGDVILVVMNGSSRWKDEITPMLEQCGAQVQTLLKADLLFLVGTIEPTFSDIHHSYTHATQLQDYQMWSVPNTVVFYDELKQSADAMQNRWKLDFKRFQDLITEKKQAEALVFIDYAYEQLIAMRPPDSKLVREVTAEMLFHIKFVLRMLSPQASLLQEGFSALVFAAYHQSGIEQLKSTVRQTLIETIAFLNHSDQEISPFIRKVMDRIHQKYADNINLSLLADEFRINPVYLGHLFKKETGEIFNNYLNRIRIEEAKRLLQQRPDLKTSDIALEVGYANTNYFYTIFKKITGQSPTDFRRELGG
jgi:two-component system response regulator YesN